MRIIVFQAVIIYKFNKEIMRLSSEAKDICNAIDDKEFFTVATNGSTFI